MKILAVDDSRMILKIIQGIVEVLGHDIQFASNGREALEVLESSSGDVNLILLDWNMPEMDGFATLKAVKSNEKYKHIPVMMVTTEAEKDRMAQAIAAGATHYITKPFSHQDLSTRIMECLGMGLDMDEDLDF